MSQTNDVDRQDVPNDDESVENISDPQTAAPFAAEYRPNSQTAQSRTFFGLKKNRFIPPNFVNGFNGFNYEAKYPEDAYGEEAGPNARVWHIYLDETGAFDMEKIGDWKDSIDIMLVFAGLFSAVVSAFVLEAQKKLQPDDAKLSSILLIELIGVQRAMANGTSAASVPLSLTGFTQDPSDIWINALWFTSLCLSLSTAFLAMLTKQWLQEYMASTSGTPRDRCRLRQYRFTGLQTWMVNVIIDFLPIIMFIALALFFAGLVIFLIPLHTTIAKVAATVAGGSFLFYILTIILSAVNPHCPYRSPFSHYIFRLIQPRVYWSLLRAAFRWSSAIPSLAVSAVSKAKQAGSPRLASLWPVVKHYSRRVLATVFSPDSEDVRTLAGAERGRIRAVCTTLDAQAIEWLLANSSNPSIKSVALQGISGLPFATRLPRDIADQTLRLLGQLQESMELSLLDEQKEERLLRTLLYFDYMGHHYIRLSPKSFLRPGAFVGHVHMQHVLRYFRDNENVKTELHFPLGETSHFHSETILPSVIWGELLSTWLYYRARPANRELDPSAILLLFHPLADSGELFPLSDSVARVNGNTATSLGTAIRDHPTLRDTARLCLFELTSINVPSDLSEQIVAYLDMLDAIIALPVSPRILSAIRALDSVRQGIISLPHSHPQSRHPLVCRLLAAMFGLMTLGEARGHMWTWEERVEIVKFFRYAALGIVLPDQPNPLASEILMQWFQDAQDHIQQHKLPSQPTKELECCFDYYDSLFNLFSECLAQSKHSVQHISSDSLSALTKMMPSDRGLSLNHQSRFIRILVRHVVGHRSSVVGPDAGHLDMLFANHDTVTNMCKILIQWRYDSEFQSLVAARPDAQVWDARQGQLEEWMSSTSRATPKRLVQLKRILAERANGGSSRWYRLSRWLRTDRTTDLVGV